MLQRSRHPAQTLLVLAAAAMVLWGCVPAALDRSAAEVAAHSAEAHRLEATGHWQEAAEAWLRAAEAARGAERDAILADAAEAWLRAGMTEQAWSALAGISAHPRPEVAAHRALVEARLLLQAERPADALSRLAGFGTAPDDPLAADLLLARADAAFASGQAAMGVTDLVRREALLDDPARLSANQRRLWNRMQEANAAGISLETPRGADGVVAGWLELGQIAAASEGNPFRLRTGLMDWRSRHPTHPGALDLVSLLLAEYQAMTEYPRRVALLLPLSSRQAAAASAVRDGFIAAYLEQGDDNGRPVVRIYDTTALGPTGAFELAARDGAEFIVGPLLKEELAELAGAELPFVPALALNWVDEHFTLPAHMTQFALAPEEEAAAVARRALVDGHQRALVLAPDNDQGRRMARGFILAFQEGGGEVLDGQVFDPRSSDFSAEIRRLLLLDESLARHQRIQAALGRSLEYEPRRRQDADFLFLAARSPEALLIRPQLRFHYATELPIYSTSLIYEPGSAGSTDLDGVLFADMPWRVGVGDLKFMAQFRAFGSHALEQNGRLYAFGADAYRLVPLIYNRSERLASGVKALTGVLRIGEDDNRVQRELEWGRFWRGRVQHAPPRVLLVVEPGLPDS
jgi:uncharacterized protein